MKFLAGQKLHLLHMYEEAPDSEENTRTVYADRISPGISELKKSSIVRLRARSKHVVAGAIVHTQVPIILPLFMDWDAQPPDDLNSDTNTSAAPLSEKAAISENLEAALKESEGEEFILRMPDMDSDSDSCKELFESELEELFELAARKPKYCKFFSTCVFRKKFIFKVFFLDCDCKFWWCTDVSRPLGEGFRVSETKMSSQKCCWTLFMSPERRCV